MRNRMKMVAVQIEDEIHVHMKGNSTYATLCGLDGDDPGAQQKMVSLPKGARINCEQCAQIYTVARMYQPSDFDMRKQYKVPKP